MGQKQSLVIMRNGDVYYVSPDEAVKLIRYVQNQSGQRFYGVKDLKSGALIMLNTNQISSVVNKETRDV